VLGAWKMVIGVLLSRAESTQIRDASNDIHPALLDNSRTPLVNKYNSSFLMILIKVLWCSMFASADKVG
jgi:hypothetical protein